MAVFTTFDQAALERYLIMYEQGELKHFSAIDAGIENSNYFVTLGDDELEQEFVLTITEDLSFEDIPFFNELLALLEKNGLKVPAPIKTLDGMSSTIFCGKPTWLFPKLPGSHLKEIKSQHCETIGRALAELHQYANNTSYSRSNPYPPEWVFETLNRVSGQLNDEQKQDLNAVAEQYQSAMAQSQLPKGIIHGDLFHDNALFVGDELGGIIDFYHACHDDLLMDIAITLNAWCFKDKPRADLEAALLKGYESVRPLEVNEQQALRDYRRFAALRFALTRFISGGDGEPLKDPLEFIDLMARL